MTEMLEDRAVPSVAAGTPWTPFGQSSEPSIIITIGKKNAVTITNTGVGPFDGIEDTYVGIVNDSGKTLPSIAVSAPSSSFIFAFDGDGIQAYGSPAPPTGGTTGYEGPDNFFSNISDNGTTATGTVNFIGGLASGQQTYFSLEGPPQAIEIGIDLQLTLDNSKVVPTQATDLHLNHFYSAESVRLPVTIQDIGTDPAKGNVTVDVFLSTTSDLTGSVTGTNPIKSINSTIDLAPSASQQLNVDVTVDSNAAAQLTAGQKYYFVLKLSSPTIQESDNQNGTDQNNIAASATSYEYVGKTHIDSVFNSGKYFKVIRDTLKSVDPFALQGAPTPTDGQHFTAAFESPGGYDNPNLGAYLDSKGIPTIGIGLNLNALDSSTKSQLAADVRSFYSTQAANNVPGYTNIDNQTDTQVINMLKTQASQAGAGGQGQDALTKADAQALFNTVYAKHQQAAATAIGQSVWDSLPSNVQWVLTDIDFNTGSVAAFKGLLGDLQAGDFVRAGFDFMDSKRSNDVQYARTLAGFEYLLQGHNSELGQLV
jgi:GH24 family phage-related lysozyme (muramidase)